MNAVYEAPVSNSDVEEGIQKAIHGDEFYFIAPFLLQVLSISKGETMKTSVAMPKLLAMKHCPNL